MSRRCHTYYRLKRRRINEQWLRDAITVKDFAQRTAYTTQAIYVQIARNRLVAYRVNGRWLIPFPPIYR